MAWQEGLDFRLYSLDGRVLCCKACSRRWRLSDAHFTTGKLDLGEGYKLLLRHSAYHLRYSLEEPEKRPRRKGPPRHEMTFKERLERFGGNRQSGYEDWTAVKS